MKSWIASLTLGFFLFSSVAANGAAAVNAKPDAGGFTPCLLTCYLGPRVGTEYNEGRGVATMEWLQLLFGVGRLVLAVEAYQGKTMSDFAKENALDTRPIPAARGKIDEKGGFGACLIAMYLGPRVAFERNQGRKVRGKDILCIVLGIGTLLQAVEAYDGQTMTQIARDEGLDS